MFYFFMCPISFYNEPKKKVLLSQNLLCAYGDTLLSFYTGQKYFHPI